MPGTQTVRAPINSAQTGIWFAAQLDPDSAGFNLAESVEIRGALDETLFELAFRRVVADFDAMRVTFHEGASGWPEQVISERSDWSLKVSDVSGAQDPVTVALDWMLAEALTPVDVSAGPSFASALFKVSGDLFFWYIRFHHIMVDGHGATTVMRRVAEVYTCLAEGRPVPPAPAGSVLDLLDQDTDYRSSPRFGLDRAYWADRLDGLPDPPTLCGRHPDEATALYNRSVEFVSQRQVDLYRSTSRDHATGWSALVNAAAAAYLHRVTGATDVSMASPVPGRRGSRRTVGMTSNFLPLRLVLDPGMTGAELMRSVTHELRALLAHQRYRYEDIRRDLGLAHTPRQLFGPTVNVLPFHNYDMTFGGSPVSGRNISLGSAQDLTVTAHPMEAGSGAEFIFDADPGAYSQEELERHGRDFVRFVNAFTAAPDTPLSGLPL
ncbi:condensation domain-containing protein [Streptosporangium sp. NPDC048865]|uniref:condensation domain-containing protein n=1 Tax=Streptosporangium sp. NPDC048865 TaxID=3155766 RepID=UPI00344A80EC